MTPSFHGSKNPRIQQSTNPLSPLPVGPGRRWKVLVAPGSQPPLPPERRSPALISSSARHSFSSSLSAGAAWPRIMRLRFAVDDCRANLPNSASVLNLERKFPNLTMIQSPPTAAEIENAIRTIPDFPKSGIQFKDITPVLADARLFSGSIDLLTDGLKPGSVDAVVGIDARGFIFAAAAAVKLEAGFIPVRKKGKLPYQTHEEEYELEYGTATVAVHIDALKPGSRVLLIDDLLATGGTAAAAAALVQRLGAHILQISFLIELSFLHGREKLKQYPVSSLVVY